MSTDYPAIIPPDNYSPTELFDFMLLVMLETAKREGTGELLNSLLSNLSRADISREFSSIICKAEEKANYSTSLYADISRILSMLGVPANLLGYEYLRYAIFLAVQDREKLCGITKILYPAIAEKFQTSPSRVERAMRHAIEVSCTRGDPKIFQNFFGNTMNPDKGKPTNSEFISKVADTLRLDSNPHCTP